jgi:hypothetical protein
VVTVTREQHVPAAQSDAVPALWRSPGLGALFTASTTARVANEAARVAVVLLILDRTGSPALAGTVVGALALPALVTGPVLGAWLDRTAHRRSAFVVNQLLLLGVLVALLAVTGTARRTSWCCSGCWPAPRPGAHRRLHRPHPAAGAGAAPATGVRRRGDQLQPGRRRRARPGRHAGRRHLAGRRGGRERRAVGPRAGGRAPRPDAAAGRRARRGAAPSVAAGCACSSPSRRCGR